MPRRGAALLSSLALLAAGPGAPQTRQDGEFVRQLVERQRDREALLDTLSYDVVERREELAEDGSVTRVRRRRFEVFHVDGRPLRRLVTENGGPLSHPGTLAREFGLPAVLSASEATHRIPDGTRIRVDGAAGVVEILN